MRTIDRDLKSILTSQVQAIDLEKCWMAGYEAAHQDKAESNNPFRLRSKEAHFWREGWWAGFYGEAALFPEYADNFSSGANQPRVEIETVSEAPVANSHKRAKYVWYSVGATFVGLAVVASSLMDFAA